MNKGMSLIEILIVVTIFAVLGVIVTRSVALTLQGSKKSETLVNIRENLDYSIGVIERQLRNANTVGTCTSNLVNYTDQNGNLGTFSCVVKVGAADSYIASGSAHLTSNTISITSCNFSCDPGTSTTPPSVSVAVSAQDANAVGVQNSTVTTTTQVSLRSY